MCRLKSGGFKGRFRSGWCRRKLLRCASGSFRLKRLSEERSGWRGASTFMKISHTCGRSLSKTKKGISVSTAAFTCPKTRYRSFLAGRNIEPKSFLPVQVVYYPLMSFWHQTHASYKHITGEIYVDINVTLFIDFQLENDWLAKLILILFWHQTICWWKIWNRRPHSERRSSMLLCYRDGNHPFQASSSILFLSLVIRTFCFVSIHS